MATHWHTGVFTQQQLVKGRWELGKGFRFSEKVSKVHPADPTARTSPHLLPPVNYRGQRPHPDFSSSPPFSLEGARPTAAPSGSPSCRRPAPQRPPATQRCTGRREFHPPTCRGRQRIRQTNQTNTYPREGTTFWWIDWRQGGSKIWKRAWSCNRWMECVGEPPHKRNNMIYWRHVLYRLLMMNNVWQGHHI